MGVKVTRPAHTFPLKCWDVQAMTQLAKAAQAAIVERTFHRGVGADDQPLAAYSDNPRSISFKSDTGRRLKPKGGLPAYGRGHPRKLLGASGRAPRGSGWTVVGRHYPGGYAEYKRSSRRGIVNGIGAGGAPVDLVLSGQLSRSLEIVAVSQARATIAIKGAALEYGPATDARRPWLAHSPRDVRDLEEGALPAIIDAALRRGSRR